MKLTLIFLLCLVVASYQQSLFNYLNNYRSSIYEPRHRSLAFYYPVQLTMNQGYGQHDFNEPADYSTVDFADIEPRRVPIRRLNNGNKPQSKFFGTDFFAQLFNNTNQNPPPASTSTLQTFTSTILLTTTSTLTIPSIKSCIGSAQFITFPAVAGNPAVTSTQVCARRRREVNMEEIEAIEAIAPSQTEPLETTQGPVLRGGRSSEGVIQPEITSSQDLPIGNVIYRPKRADFVVANVTSTITAYSFISTSVIKSFTLVGNAALSCLPAGYTIC